MSVIVQLTVDSGEFLLGRVVSDIEDLSVELDRVVPSDGRIMPYLWASGSNLEEFDRALCREPAVERVERLDRIAGEALYRIEWDPLNDRFTRGLSRAGAAVLDAFGAATWEFRLRFETDEDLSWFHQYCRANDISYHLDRLYPLTSRETASTYRLTDAQRHALVVATEQGYFEIPRQARMIDIAEQLDISEQATSERIRRGLNKVLTTTVLDGESGTRENDRPEPLI
jgi:predicted DNA binding protein